MDFFNVRRRLCRWQLDRSLDPIKYEANHLFVTGEVTITLFKFFCGDGLRLGEDRVDTMNGGALDTRDVASILLLPSMHSRSHRHRPAGAWTAPQRGLEVARAG